MKKFSPLFVLPIDFRHNSRNIALQSIQPINEQKPAKEIMNILQNQIDAKNKINSIANSFQNFALDIAKPFIGKKIILANGDLSKEFRDAVTARLTHEFSREKIPGLSFYKQSSNYTLSFELSISYPTGEFSCNYAKASVYVGNYDVAILKELFPHKEFRTNYKLEEIIEARNKIEKLNKKIDKLKEKIFPFGDSNNY